MAAQIPTGDIHHLRLTVTDLQRSRDFYTSLLGFQVAAESPPPDDPAAGEVFKILFGGEKAYVLSYGGRGYDSKAILGVAYRFARGQPAVPPS